MTGNRALLLHEAIIPIIMEERQKKALLESIFFVSGMPVNLKELQTITDFSTGEITYLINELIAEYRKQKRGLLLVEVAEGYQMVSNPEFSEWIKRMKSSPSQRISVASLETLAIVAYKQPITRAEIDQIRGVSSDSVLKGLLDRRFIKIVGKKEAPGRPLIYRTTKEFLLYFGLKDLSELPTLRELNPEEF